MELELINTLSESSIFRSKSYLDRFSPEQNANLFYLYTLAVYALYKNESTNQWAKNYISRTMAFGNFDYFRNAETDLYMLAHLMSNSKYFDENAFKKFLLDIKNDRTTNFYIFLTKLETLLRIKNPNYKNVKRTLANWDNERPDKTYQALQTLYRELYYITPVSEVLKPMQTLRKTDAEKG